MATTEQLDLILAIEQEARAALLAELRAKVEALPMDCHDFYNEAGHDTPEDCSAIDRAAVLEAMEAMQRALSS